MTTFEILNLCMGGTGLLGILGLSFAFGRMFQKIENIEREVRKIDSIDQRLSRLEAAFQERGQWESKLEIKK